MNFWARLSIRLRPLVRLLPATRNGAVGSSPRPSHPSVYSYRWFSFKKTLDCLEQVLIPQAAGASRGMIRRLFEKAEKVCLVAQDHVRAVERFLGREILEDLISFYRLGDKVRIVGFESDIRKIWGDHGLLVLPSLSEGTPISLIEAQLCARASLVTRVDRYPEWVEEGKTGFLAEAPTVYHLRLTLERAWENRHRWAEMGNAARAACLAKRDPDLAGTPLALLRKAANR